MEIARKQVRISFDIPVVDLLLKACMDREKEEAGMVEGVFLFVFGCVRSVF